MDLSILEKIVTVLKTIFSSFLGIELFLLCTFFLVISILNLREKVKIINYFTLAIFSMFIICLIIFNIDYAVYCMDKVLKLIINYIYFPSTVVYFYIEILVVIILMITIFSKKITDFKKIFNYVFFTFFNLLFFLFISVISYNKIDLASVVDLYSDNSILSLVQIGNFLFVMWFIFTLFYNLFRYFKRYDRKVES